MKQFWIAVTVLAACAPLAWCEVEAGKDRTAIKLACIERGGHFSWGVCVVPEATQ